MAAPASYSLQGPRCTVNMVYNPKTEPNQGSVACSYEPTTLTLSHAHPQSPETLHLVATQIRECDYKEAAECINRVNRCAQALCCRGDISGAKGLENRLAQGEITSDNLLYKDILDLFAKALFGIHYSPKGLSAERVVSYALPGGNWTVNIVYDSLRHSSEKSVKHTHHPSTLTLHHLHLPAPETVSLFLDKLRVSDFEGARELINRVNRCRQTLLCREDVRGAGELDDRLAQHEVTSDETLHTILMELYTKALFQTPRCATPPL